MNSLYTETVSPRSFLGDIWVEIGKKILAQLYWTAIWLPQQKQMLLQRLIPTDF